MKKIIFSSLLILFLLPFSTSAQTTTGTKVASVNIQQVQVQQEQNGYAVSFTITNGSEIQTGLRYGVRLLGQSAQQYIVDEKPYDEQLTLRENTSITKQIQYIPPATLNGTYQIVLVIYNNSGFPFAIAPGGNITLTGTAGITIEPETCVVQAGATKSDITKTILAFPTTNLILTCTVKNTTDSTVTTQPTLETRIGSLFGNEAQTAGTPLSAISLASGEQKSITMMLPKAIVPQTYIAKLWMTGAAVNSNPIIIHYTIYGAMAAIQNLSFDKDAYNVGDTANLSLLWNGSVQNANLTLSIANSNGLRCADDVVQTINTKPIVQIPVHITRICANPAVTVTLKDAQGNVFDQKVFKILSNTHTSKKQILIVILAIVIVAVAGWYMRKKKHTAVNPVTVLFIGIAFVGLSVGTVHADVYTSGPNGDILSVVAMPDGNNYGTGSSITVTAQVFNSSSTASYPVNLLITNNSGSPIKVVPDITLNAGQNTKLYTYTFDNPNGAPSVVGNYPMKFSTGVDGTAASVLGSSGVYSTPVQGGTNDTNVVCDASISQPLSNAVTINFQYQTNQSATQWEQCTVSIPAGDTAATNYPGREYFGPSGLDVDVTDSCFDTSTSDVPNSSGSGVRSC